MDNNSAKKVPKLVIKIDEQNATKCAVVSPPVDESSVRSAPLIAKDASSSAVKGASEERIPKRKRPTEVDRMLGDEGVQRILEEECKRKAARLGDRRSNSSTQSERGKTAFQTNHVNNSSAHTTDNNSSSKAIDASPPHIVPSDAENEKLPPMGPMETDSRTVDDDDDDFQNVILEKFKKKQIKETRLRHEKEALEKEKIDLYKVLEEKANELAKALEDIKDLKASLMNANDEFTALKKKSDDQEIVMEKEKNERLREKNDNKKELKKKDEEMKAKKDEFDAKMKKANAENAAIKKLTETLKRDLDEEKRKRKEEIENLKKEMEKNEEEMRKESVATIAKWDELLEAEKEKNASNQKRDLEFWELIGGAMKLRGTSNSLAGFLNGALPNGLLPLDKNNGTQNQPSSSTSPPVSSVISGDKNDVAVVRKRASTDEVEYIGSKKGKECNEK